MQDAASLAATIRKHDKALRTLGYRVRFELTDTEEVILLDATGVTVAVTQESSPADTVLTLASDDLARMIDGRLNPTFAFATGRLKIEGSRGVALKLANLLDSD